MRLITRHFISNYGSFLQTYATQQFIGGLGYQTYVLDYINKDEKPLFDAVIKSKKYKGVKRIIYFFVKRIDLSISYKAFKEYRKKYLKVIPFNTSINQKDVYLSGSDQLWGQMPNGKIDENYYLKFVDSSSVKISLSSSFGTYPSSEEEVLSIKKLLSEYKFISVRENSSLNYLQSLGVKQCFTTYDPTMLVERNFWNRQINNKRIIKEKYILVYQIHNDSLTSLCLDKIHANYDCKIASISVSLRKNKEADFNFKNIDPFDFLNLIKNAEFVITDSFHCTVFSIIFNKQFINTINNRTSNRIQDLLSDFNLESRIVKNCDAKTPLVLIDYKEINKIFDEKTKKSGIEYSNYLNNIFKENE